MLEAVADMLPRLLHGALDTLVIMAACTLLSLPIALMVAIGGGLSSSKPIRFLAASYVFAFRSSPALVQLFLIYYAFSMSETLRQTWAWYFFQDPWFCGILALTLNTAAYQAEIFRAGLQLVPKEQLDASLSLGLSKVLTFWLVRAPGAFRLALPAYTNELILLLKTTAIVSTITILDLLGTAKLIYTETFDPFTPLMLAAAIYLLLVWMIQWAMSKIEWWLMPHMRSSIAIPQPRKVVTPALG
ncbi:octopine/nopaline transport system permease protein [Rhodoligotrophos appendicifer]|uniref:ABC transporter permease n=1 Tax=Rhodoligotrophos appendicifer TaxID=987056 RepID=UPI00147947D6|nr:ABC transporter permease subunit [Rhodoligotrophos appendicifer]